ncbi:MAG: M20/M25/M40 family metallo-hydrolase [Bacteroidales bacterium]|nr:M20/M25/M40 family metallo-hydrolase [Candidatus Cryptobacteroides aphodequi]
MIDTALFEKILSIDSTSGRERALADLLFETVDAPSKERFELEDGSANLLFSWGEPKVVFCTHMDTVPPYLPPVFDGDTVRGRGSCDAKGQIIAMLSACRELAAEGKDGFALLLLSGEETGSFGAKAFSGRISAPLLVIGEPTGNRPVSASKGTRSFDVHFEGVPFHSGYPERGRSAVDMFLDFMICLEVEAEFQRDRELGETTWNVGELHSPNAQNILSPALDCRIYFRTTFASEAAVDKWMARKVPGVSVVARGGDSPARYFVPEGMKGVPAAFGSDAPHLAGFGKKMICGPGSIMVAHRDDECVSLAELEQATEIYKQIYNTAL